MKVDQLIISVRAKFIHNLRILKLPAEFNGFVSMVDTNDENFRNLRLSNFNYCLDTDVSSPKYSICKSWNSLPFEIKSTQPDEFLDTLRNYFNSCNDKVCQIENCWLCGPRWAISHDLTTHTCSLLQPRLASLHLIYDWAIWKIPDGCDVLAELSLDAHQVYNLSGGP